MQLIGNDISKEFKPVFYVLLTTVVCLAFSIRFVNSLSIIGLFFLVFLTSKRKALVKNAFLNVYFLCCLGIFVLQIVGLFYTSNFNGGIKEVTQKAGIVAIPFFFCAYNSLPQKIFDKLAIVFSISLLVVSLYCMVIAVFGYLRNHDTSVFFYHSLVAPAGHHAVLFSFYLFYCLLFWLDNLSSNHKKMDWSVLLISLILIMIFLLSSKLIIASTLIVLIYYALKHWLRGLSKINIYILLILFSLMAFLGLFTDNPVKKRFIDLTTGNNELFKQENFSPDIYFNGVQFRLLTWRLTYEILNEKKAWVFGVSPGNAQEELNAKYKSHNLYLGTGNQGFWNFNCHNVYLQTLLESGVIGLACLIAIVIQFVIQCFRRSKRHALIFFFAIILFGFTESLLSAQYTILLFAFFPLLSLTSEKKVTRISS